MIKRTVYFERPAYLHTRKEQLVVSYEDENDKSIPIEDIGFAVIDHPQVRLTKSELSKMQANNAAVIITNEKHMPAGLMLTLDGNTLQQERYRSQLNIKEPLRKKLWKQVVQAKIRNQAKVLKKIGVEGKQLTALVPKVMSGDTSNVEATAARRYWKLLFSEIEFKRDRFEEPPNNVLNYGYAIMRAVIARSIVGAGLLPLIGIHHKNRYNAYPLADDLMEPFRPFVDEIGYRLVKANNYAELNREVKQELLKVPSLTVRVNKEKSPLMLAATNTAVSLYKCLQNKDSSIVFPEPCN